jgi:hypothetical protein
MSRLFPRARLVLLAGLMAVSPIGACEQEPGFECGRLVPGTSTIRRCDRALEVCVCATNSCARRVGFTDAEQGSLSDGGSGYAGEATAKAWGDCRGPGETGYVYAEAPYARDDLAGKCVPEIHLRLGDIVPSKEAPGPGCPGQFELPVGGTSSAGTGGSSPVGGSEPVGGGHPGEGGLGGEAGRHDGGAAGMSVGGMGAVSTGGDASEGGASASGGGGGQ